MPKVPPQKYRKVIKVLRRNGFIFRRSSGSHEIWWNEQTKSTCVVPHHIEVKGGTIRSIAKQSGINVTEFI